MENEVWKDIPAHEGLYQVSNKGNVRSWKNGRWGKEKFHVPDLCAEEKRWLTERGIPYRYDSRLHEWTIKSIS
ncbi:MAG TPA: NUMOD4 domain-containing protein [Massilibacterium sp.]|nr:NUMOD4 domain-containing protein [Massilibacterium sp.]